MHKLGQIIISTSLIISLILFIVSVGFIHSVGLFIFDDVLFALTTFYNLIVTTYYISRNKLQKLDRNLLIVNIAMFLLFFAWYTMTVK